MLKKLAKKIFIIVLMLVTLFSTSVTALAQKDPVKMVNTYELTYKTAIELKEGEKAQIPLTLIKDNSAILPNENFIGDVGVLSLWVSKGTVYYSIKLDIPATSFTGLMHITDLTSGFGGGYTPVSGFSGSVPTSNISGHKYSASLSGIAYLGPVPVAKTGNNYITWIN
jgi:hypothetical protein